jgi:ATP-dependent 26S proteasome regulatory subunit
MRAAQAFFMTSVGHTEVTFMVAQTTSAALPFAFLGMVSSAVIQRYIGEQSGQVTTVAPRCLSQPVA